MTQAHDAENRQMTIMVVTEPNTQTFQLGETIADTIEETKKVISSTENEQDVTIVTNSLYLNGWANKHGYNATLVNDEEMLTHIAHESIPVVVMVPAIETLAIKPEEGIALVPNDENILVTIQDELTRRDDDGQAVHPDVMITLMLPPEYRMVRANNDPDTYIRVIATAKLSN
jgi:hypothetical protein